MLGKWKPWSNATITTFSKTSLILSISIHFLKKFAYLSQQSFIYIYSITFCSNHSILILNEFFLSAAMSSGSSISFFVNVLKLWTILFSIKAIIYNNFSWQSWLCLEYKSTSFFVTLFPLFWFNPLLNTRRHCKKAKKSH